jgi:hypothetical protein
MKKEGNTGIKPTIQKQLDNRARCEAAFNKGWGILFAAKELKMGKNNVHAYYKEFREKLEATMDQEFILEQKTAKQMGIMALDEEIRNVDTMINDPDHGIQIKVIEDPENPAWLSQLKSAIELRSNLKQQRYNLEMSPTIDVSVDTIVSELREESDAKN